MKYIRVYEDGHEEECTKELKTWFIRVHALGWMGGTVLGLSIMLLIPK